MRKLTRFADSNYQMMIFFFWSILCIVSRTKHLHVKYDALINVCMCLHVLFLFYINEVLFIIIYL